MSRELTAPPRSIPETPRPAARSANGSPAAAQGNAPVSCRHCGQTSAGNRKFCAHCGKSLWEPCPKCGVEGPATETFCGACGANIITWHQERAERFEAELGRAHELHKSHDYRQALDVLAILSRSDALRLERQVQAARDLATQWTAERDRRLAEAEGVLAKARELQAAHSYETAVAALEEVPPPLRSEEFRTCYAQVHSQWREMLGLGGEIRQALEQKQTLGLFPKLERLLELQPQHAQARQLADQLRDRYVQFAKKKLAVHQYSDALALAKEIPAFVRTPEIEDLQVRAAELTWLLADLTNAPVVDKPLLAVAERLVKFAPSNQEAVKLQAKLAERAKTKPKDARFALPLWAAPPEKTRLGMPVDWLGGFSTLAAADEEIAAQLVKHPGALFVAAGLALQGIESAAVNLNLLPKQKTSMLDGLSLLRKKKQAVRAAWGLDLTDTGLKAVKLVCDEQGENPKIAVCAALEHKKHLGQADVQGERAEIVAATLRAFLDTHNLAGCKVCASLGGSMLLARFFNLPPLPKKQIAAVVEVEAKHQIPFALSELAWDYELLDGRAESDRDDVQRTVLLLAAKEFQVRDRLAQFQNAGIEIDALNGDAVALHNLAVHELLAENADKADADRSGLALLDVGSDSTNLVISSPRRIWFRTLRMGGDDFTKGLVKQFKLSFAQAEQLKRDPTKARRLSQLYEALDPLFAELAAQVERSLTAYENERLGIKIDRLFALGGSLKMHGLLRHLRG